MSISSGQVSPIMGQTLLKPLAQFMDKLCMGQLQSQSHSPPPSGQVHLHEHCIPSPVDGEGPDPVGCSPDPDPIGGAGSDPDPVGEGGPDPEAGGGTIVIGSGSALQFDIDPFPFLTLSLKENMPISTLPAPEHFLSQLAVPLQLVPSASRLKEHLHFFFPNVTFWFLKSSCEKYGLEKATFLLFSTYCKDCIGHQEKNQEEPHC